MLQPLGGFRTICGDIHDYGISPQFTLYNPGFYVLQTLAVHLLATICMLTTNDITLPYKTVYLDSKIATATMHGCLFAPQMLHSENVY